MISKIREGLKKIILIFIFLIMQFLGYSQNGINLLKIKDEQVRNLRVKANVIVRKMLVYKANQDGKLPDKGDLRSIDSLNRNGESIISLTYYYGDTTKTKKEYDKNGNVVKLVSYKRINGVWEERFFIKSKYDINGELLRSEYYKPNGELLWATESILRKEGDLTIRYDTIGKIESKTEVFYDSIQRIYISRLLSTENELLVEDKYFLNDKLKVLKWEVVDNIQKFIERYAYDIYGNEIEKIRTDFDGNPIYKFEYTYDNKGLLIESIWYEPIEKKKQVIKYVYEYFK